LIFPKGANRKRILLVDDDTSVTQMLKMLLETRGYVVTVASSGRAAFEKVEEATDLILLDVVLPDQDGFDICRRFKENRDTRHIPIIILSAKMLSQDIIEALYLGADDYLTKPFEYEELVARMETVMRRRFLVEDVQSSRAERSFVREIRKIIERELVTPFFQPIFLVETMEVFGFEALCRPHSTTLLANPEMLFKAALRFGFYQELELLSWRRAIEDVACRLKGEKVFLNCNPYLVEGPQFLKIKSIFEENAIDVNNVVLEITERSSVSNFKTFYQHLAHYRDHGFQFAVDDVGGGYASLEAIVETKPEVVKIDRHIVANLNQDPFKKSIIKFIVAFCKENGILSIAEGIETREDLEGVIDLGVDAVQGYFLSRPSPHIDRQALSDVGGDAFSSS